MVPTSRDPIASTEVVRAVVNVIVIATCFCVMAVMIALLADHESNFVFCTMVVVAALVTGGRSKLSETAISQSGPEILERPASQRVPICPWA